MSDFDLSNFLASFFDEARERLLSINQHLVNFEAGKITEEEMIDLRRDAHTIKGSALMLGVKDVGGVGHLFEDVIAQMIEHVECRTPAMIQFLYDLHDKLAVRLEDSDSQDLLDPDVLRTAYDDLLQSFNDNTGEQEEADAITPADQADEPAMGLIGMDEAQAWKTSKKAEAESLKAKDIDTDVEAAPIEDTFESLALTPLPEDANITFDTFRPDVSQEEMKATGQKKSSGRFMRVDAERLEELSNHVIELSTEQSRGELIESSMQDFHLEMRALRREWRQFKDTASTANKRDVDAAILSMDTLLDHQVRKTRNFIDEFRHGQSRSAIVLTDLRDQVLALMLRPLDTIFSTLPRSVRDVAARVNKRVNLQISGKSVEIDQGVAEALVEPLIHLLNNAVAHGIESPEDRKNIGKSEDGQITIIARQSGNEVRIEVIDDGRGIDEEKIKQVAVESGVTTQLEADDMDSAEILEMIFRPGFSTHTDVDTLAGRGIGMNVVQDTLRRLTGSIRIHTEIGKGTRFVLSLPVRIAVQNALIFRMGDQRFGMLTHMIDQVIPLQSQQLEKGVGGKNFVRYGKHMVPIVDLRRMMTSDETAISDYPYVLISEHIEGFVGIVIDELFNDHEIVVRDLDPYIKRYQPQGLMGNTIAADGSVLLLLEPYGIKEMGRTSPDDALDMDIGDQDKFHCKVLLVDDSLIARKIEQSLLKNLGLTVDTAIDGLDALSILEASSYDMIITDLEMPRLDGFGLVRHVRNLPQYEDLPILIISTRESHEDRMRAMEAGADAYFVKQQLDSESLLNNIRMLVEPMLGDE